MARHVSCGLLKVDYYLQVEVLMCEPQEIIERQCFCCSSLLHRVIIIFTRKVNKLVDYSL